MSRSSILHNCSPQKLQVSSALWLYSTMTRYNYVCFKCRLARRAIRNINPKCPACGIELKYIGLCPVPKKSKIKDWSRIEELYCKPVNIYSLLPDGYEKGQPVVKRLIDELKEYENTYTKSGKRRFKRAKLHMYRIFHGDLSG